MSHNSGPQPVVLGIVASFSFNFHFTSNTFRIILAVPSKQGFCNISTVISKSSFCIHFSNCFVTVPNAPITTGITSTSLILHFSSSFSSIRVSNGHVGSMRKHFLVFFSITVISGLLCSSVLSVCMGKSHEILHSSDSNTFSGFCV